nr:Proteinase inhibitor I3, Kunitz legume [Ipomoea batatas]
MKTLHQLLPYVLFSLSFLPFIAFSIRQFPLPPVVGVDGKEVKLGESYYFFSTLFPPVGLCLVDNVKCPTDIIQCPSYYDDPRGLPFTFSSVANSTEDTVVRVDTPYRIELSAPAAGNCSNETFWFLKDDGIPGMNFVAIGPKTVAVEFTIQKVVLGYKIVGCVVLPFPPLPICFGVGFVPEFGFNRLGIGSDVQPVEFFFAKTTIPLPPVISVEGKEVKLGESYYAFSNLFPPVGVCLVDNVKCPKDIIQCPTFYDDPRGLPVTFSSVANSTEDTVVREDTPYRIELSAPGNCSDENFWYLKEEDGYADNDFVAIGPKKLAVEFIVQKVESGGYKMMQCVLIPIPPYPICYDVGFVSTYGYNRLGIGSGVLPAQFFFSIGTTNSTVAVDKPART